MALSLYGQGYPEQPIQVIVPTGPGGTIDKIARLFQQEFSRSELVSQKLVIQNVPGAGGSFGTSKIKAATPDGYTIGLWGAGLITSKLMGHVNYDHHAFDIIAETGKVHLGLGARDDSRFSTIEETIDHLKKDPQSVNIATNLGLPVHFFPLIFAETAQVDFRFVQVGGGAKRLASILGGHTNIGQFSILEFETYRNTNPEKVGIKPLVLFTNKRSPQIPDTPTAKELGYDIELYESIYWLAPKGLPENVLMTLRDAFSRAMQSPELLSEFEIMGMQPTFSGPKQIETTLNDLLRRCLEIPKEKFEVSDVVPINFPTLLLSITALLAVLFCLRLRGVTFQKKWSYQREPMRAVAFMGVAILYIAALPLLGFRISTLISAALFGFTLNGFRLFQKERMGVALMAVILGIGVFYLFDSAFKISLP